MPIPNIPELLGIAESIGFGPLKIGFAFDETLIPEFWA